MSSTTSPGSSRLPVSEAAARPLLSVIIVTWNVGDLLRNCLRSLADDGVPNWAEVIVVDNASPDDTCAMVRGEFPWVNLIANEVNLGFSRGNNLAIRQSSGEFVLLLNPDTVVQPGTLQGMLDAAAANPRAGIVGPKQLNGDGTIQYDCAVELPTIWNVMCDLMMLSKLFPRSTLFAQRKMGHWDHNGDREVPAVPGSAMLVRREVIERIGLLDEAMFITEDMDYCRRARAAGWSVFYAGSVAITHYGGASLKRAPRSGQWHQVACQSFWLYQRKHRGRLAATSLSAILFGWSLCVLMLAGPLSLVLRGNETILHQRIRALSALRWSVANKKRFRHYLAAAPNEV